MFIINNWFTITGECVLLQLMSALNDGMEHRCQTLQGAETVLRLSVISDLGARRLDGVPSTYGETIERLLIVSNFFRFMGLLMAFSFLWS